MTSSRTTPSTLALSSPSSFRRGYIRRRRSDPDLKFAIAVALFLAVVIASAVAVAIAAQTIPDIGSLYITVT